MKKNWLIVFLLLLTLSSCQTKNAYFKSELDIEKVDNLSPSFIKGMDVSSLISLEQSGVKYYDIDHKEKDLLKILKKHGDCIGINEPLLKYRLSKGGKSRNKLKSAKMHYKSLRYAGFSVFKSCIYFVTYAINGVIKHYL